MSEGDINGLFARLGGDKDAEAWSRFARELDVVYQAAGMVAVQAGTNPSGAMARLRARARAEGQPLAYVCHEVVDGALTLDP